jgi:hypothetical protein
MRPIISKSSSGTAEWQLDAAMAVAVLASGTLTGLLDGPSFQMSATGSHSSRCTVSTTTRRFLRATGEKDVVDVSAFGD